MVGNSLRVILLAMVCLEWWRERGGGYLIFLESLPIQEKLLTSVAIRGQFEAVAWWCEGGRSGSPVWWFLPSLMSLCWWPFSWDSGSHITSLPCAGHDLNSAVMAF